MDELTGKVPHSDRLPGHHVTHGELDQRLGRIEDRLKPLDQLMHALSQLAELGAAIHRIDEGLRGDQAGRPGVYRRLDQFEAALRDASARLVEVEAALEKQEKAIATLESRFALAEAAVKLAAAAAEKTATELEAGLKTRLTWHHALLTAVGLTAFGATFAAVVEGIKRALGWK